MTKERYITIQSWMVTDLKLKSNELIIYALIHGFCQDGKSYFHGSLKYIMENTNLSKDTVIEILKSLLDKNLIAKKKVQSYKIFDTIKEAHGNVYYCLYYTVRSREGTQEISAQRPSVNEPVRNGNPEYEEKNNTGQKILPEEPRSENPTGESSPVGNSYRHGSENPTGAGQKIRPETGRKFLPNILNLNKFNTTTSNKEAEEPIKKKIQELFGYPITFDPDPIPCFLKLMEEYGIDDYKDYLDWSYSSLKNTCKDKEKFEGYYYKMFTSENLISKYVKYQVDKHNKDKRTCPVCGKMMSKGARVCSVCDFDFAYYRDEDVIAVERQVFRLPEETRRSFREDIQKYEQKYFEDWNPSSFDKSQTEKKKNELLGIYKKYGIRSNSEEAAG